MGAPVWCEVHVPAPGRRSWTGFRTLEESLATAVKAACVGALAGAGGTHPIGGGVPTDCLYLELCDLRRGLTLVRETLLQQQAPRETVVQYYLQRGDGGEWSEYPVYDPEPDFAVGDPVQVILNHRNRRTRKGIIRRVRWNNESRTFSYYLVEDGDQKLAKAFFKGDLKKVK
jgi:hypothetical protein